MATSFFAVLGFIAVPIGERTAYEHVKLALATPEGQQTTAALARAYGAIQDRVVEWVVEKVSSTTPMNDLPTVLDRKKLMRNTEKPKPDPQP